MLPDFNKGNILLRWIIFSFHIKGVDNSHINYKGTCSLYDLFKLNGVQKIHNTREHRVEKPQFLCIRVVSDEYISRVHLQMKSLLLLESLFFPIQFHRRSLFQISREKWLWEYRKASYLNANSYLWLWSCLGVIYVASLEGVCTMCQHLLNAPGGLAKCIIWKEMFELG